MKLLNFSVTVETNEYNEMNVPYIRHLLARAVPGHTGRVKVCYIPGMDEKTAEEIEKDADDRGEIEL